MADHATATQTLTDDRPPADSHDEDMIVSDPMVPCPPLLATPTRRLGWRGFVCICACCVVVSASGVPHAFNAYANSFKAVFNLTQAQVETVCSVMFFGGGANLPAGVMLDHVGPFGTMTATLFLTSTGWLLMWSATQYLAFIQSNYFILALYFFIGAHGRTYAFVTGLVIAMQQVRPSLRAVMIVVVEAFFDIGSFTFVFAYETAFVDGHVLDAENQKLPEYFLSVAIAVLIVNVVGVVVIPRFRRSIKNTDLIIEDTLDRPLHIEKMEDSEDISKTIIHNTAERTESTDGGDCDIKRKKRVRFWKGIHIKKCICTFKCICTNATILTVQFQFILWSTAILMSVCVFTSFNLTYITGSLELTEYDYWLVMCHRIFVVIGRVLLGFPMALLNSFKSLVEIILVFSAVLVLICQCVLLLAGHLPTGIFLSVIGTGIAHGSSYILAPILIDRYFGMEKYGRNIGLVYTFVPLLVLFLQLLFGYSYDNVASRQVPGSHSCYGMECLVTGLAINIAISVIGLVLSVAILVRSFIHKPSVISTYRNKCC